MSLAEGQRLGPYEVLGRTGAGGMGEVYRARDTRLDRTVALKVLPSEVSADAALRSRFEREARAISALAHPHICTLFDVGEQDGRTFLVMEHLEGQTLLERLRKGPLPLGQAVEVAAQVAEALSSAHKQGVVHRDLKPGNVMLTKSGAKLLDFGLARLVAHGERPAVESLTAAPTAPAPLTGQGTILGTLPYMAPEQLEGRPADARTDLWALGLLIYEMLTGRRAFEGQSQVSLIGAILEREPEPLARLQPLTPPALERLVKRCLAKSPDDRWDTAHDVADELRWIADAGSAVAEGTSHRPRWMRTLGLAVAAIACVLLGVLADRWWRPNVAPASPVVHALLDIQPAEELNGGGVSPLSVSTPGGSRTALDWTPDGTALVFVGRRGGIQQLYVRDLGRDEAHPLAGTEGAQAPAVSTDGRWVAFWASGKIKRIPILGGPTSVLVSGLGPPPQGMAWGPSGRLYYSGNEGRIWRVAPETVPEPVTTLFQTELVHGLPHVLPGEKALLFTVRRRIWTWGDEEVVAQDLATGKRKALLRDAVDARYVRRGHLVFMRGGALMAAPFDLNGLTVQGEPAPVLDGVGHAITAGNSDDVTGAGQFAMAKSGTLAYVAGPVRPYPKATLVAVDREGRVSPLAAPTQSYEPTLDLARDGRRLAVVTPTSVSWPSGSSTRRAGHSRDSREEASRSGRDGRPMASASRSRGWPTVSRNSSGSEPTAQRPPSRWSEAAISPLHGHPTDSTWPRFWMATSGSSRLLVRRPRSTACRKQPTSRAGPSSRPTGNGSPTDRTRRAGMRSTSNLGRAGVRANRCRSKEAGARPGIPAGASCSSCLGSMPRVDGECGPWTCRRARGCASELPELSSTSQGLISG